MYPKTYRILSDAVEAGVKYGWRRVFKYTDQPDDESACDQIADAVMSEISEMFDFDDVNTGV